MNKVLFSLSLSLAVHSAFAADAVRQDLLSIYLQAKSNDSTWASARSAQAAAQEKLVQGKALTLPTVGFSANANHSDTNLEYKNAGSAFARQGGGNENFDTYSYSLNINHPLYRKQNTVQYEQSKTQVAQADEILNGARLDLMMRTAQAYFDVLTSQDKIDLIIAQKAAITKQLEQAKANFEVGTSTITDVHEAQARYDLLIAQEIAARNDLEIRKRSILAIIGKMPEDLTPAKEALIATIPAPQEMEQWVAIAEQNNPQLRIQQQSLTYAGQEVERTHAGHLPTLDAVGNFTDTRSNGSANGIASDSQSVSIGLQLQMPLYQGGAISSREREAVTNQQKAREDVETARRKATLDTQQAYLNVSSAVASVKAYEQALASSQSSLDSTSLGYEVGVRTSVDVLNAQQQYYSAKRDLLEARYNWLLSVIKLKGVAGVLTDNDFAETNRMLEGS